MGKILVTGADGFIGSHIVESLVREGYSVRAFVQYNSFNSWGWLDNVCENIKKEVEVFSGDIRDFELISEAIKTCNKIIHLAALIAIPYSYQTPRSYIETNVLGTLNLLQASRTHDVERFIHTSTSEVYGSARYVPIDEKHPLQGQSPYSASKIGADQLAFSFFSSFGLPVVTVRPFNTFGPRQSARAFIPTVITQCLNSKERIRLGALQTTRDFSFINDTVDGFISILKSSEGCGETFNLGSGFEITMEDTAKIIINKINPALDICEDPNRLRPKKSEVNRLLSNNELALKTFNWKPRFNTLNGFELGIEKTIDWFTLECNKKLYKVHSYTR
jgi:NAD dependent epimerase/dehydratase